MRPGAPAVGIGWGLGGGGFGLDVIIPKKTGVIWGGDPGLQLSGLEKGRFGLGSTILNKMGVHLRLAAEATWGSSCRGWRKGKGFDLVLT